MSLLEFVNQKQWNHTAIYGHLHRNGLCADTCSQLSEIASPDHTACIEHLKSLNHFHLAKILAKEI